jgi:hypothetical protein
MFHVPACRTFPAERPQLPVISDQRKRPLRVIADFFKDFSEKCWRFGHKLSSSCRCRINNRRQDSLIRRRIMFY